MTHHHLTHKEEVKGGHDSHMHHKKMHDHHMAEAKKHAAHLHRMAKHGHKHHAKKHEMQEAAKHMKMHGG